MTDALLFAGHTRRATIVTPDVSGLVLDTPAIREAVERVRAEQAAMEENVRIREDESLPRRRRAAAYRRVEELESSRAMAQADVVRAVRTANPGAEPAAVEYAGRSAAYLVVESSL